MVAVYYIGIAVILVSIGLIILIGKLIKKWYNLYKDVKYVKEERERQESETSKTKAGRINARRKW